jgi:predicted HicB family RNase H-like nuclease
LAYFLKLPYVSAFGNTEGKTLYELQDARQAVNENHLKRSEKIPVASARRHYSNQFNIRIDCRIYQALAIEVSQGGISLKALVTQKLIHAPKSLSENKPPNVLKIHKKLVKHDTPKINLILLTEPYQEFIPTYMSRIACCGLQARLL